jgi:L-rhamnose isomerase / sugar isomerase
MLNPDSIRSADLAHADEHRRDFDFLGERLLRRGVPLEPILERVQGFAVAIPSWALGTGGTRFGRFPGEGEPRDIYEKMDDVAVIHRLTGAAPRVSLHIPWDEPDDLGALAAHAAALGLAFDAVNSNTFQDQPGQERS